MLGRSHQITSVAVALTGSVFVKTTPFLSNRFALNGLLTLRPTESLLHVHLTWVIWALIGVAWGALWPDIDTPSSKISHRHPLLALAFTKIGHREITHSLIVIVGLGIVSFGISFLINFFPGSNWLQAGVIGCWIGYTLHVIEDSFSIQGIRWLAPFSAYDEADYLKYGHKEPKIRRTVEGPEGQTIVYRHWWGHGYRTGGQFEIGIDILAVILAVLAVYYVFK